jgi:hypothetical protein
MRAPRQASGPSCWCTSVSQPATHLQAGGAIGRAFLRSPAAPARTHRPASPAAGYSVVQGPATPLVRPHPAFWRLVHGCMVCYLLFMIYMLFQSVDDARQLLKARLTTLRCAALLLWAALGALGSGHLPAVRRRTFHLAHCPGACSTCTRSWGRSFRRRATGTTARSTPPARASTGRRAGRVEAGDRCRPARRRPAQPEPPALCAARLV